MHGADRVQISQRAEQRGDSSDGLTRCQVLSPGHELGQTAARRLIKDQGQGVLGQGHGSVLTNQVLVVDPVEHGHGL